MRRAVEDHLVAAGPHVQPERDRVAHRARRQEAAPPPGRAARPRAPGARSRSGRRSAARRRPPRGPSRAASPRWARLRVAEQVDRHRRAAHDSPSVSATSARARPRAGISSRKVRARARAPPPASPSSALERPLDRGRRAARDPRRPPGRRRRRRLRAARPRVSSPGCSPASIPSATDMPNPSCADACTYTEARRVAVVQHVLLDPAGERHVRGRGLAQLVRGARRPTAPRARTRHRAAGRPPARSPAVPCAPRCGGRRSRPSAPIRSRSACGSSPNGSGTPW